MIQGDAGNCRDVGEIGRAERSHAADVLSDMRICRDLQGNSAQTFAPCLPLLLAFLLAGRSESRGVVGFRCDNDARCCDVGVKIHFLRQHTMALVVVIVLDDSL